jgi:hypothetical protein
MKAQQPNVGRRREKPLELKVFNDERPLNPRRKDDWLPFLKLIGYAKPRRPFGKRDF